MRDRLILDIAELGTKAVAIKHDITAEVLSKSICKLLDQLCLLSDDESERFEEWVAAAKRTRCEIIGGHDWTYDHCCYWWHIYCCGCGKRKYPEIPTSHSDAIERLGDITEEEYIERRQSMIDAVYGKESDDA